MERKGFLHDGGPRRHIFSFPFLPGSKPSTFDLPFPFPFDVQMKKRLGNVLGADGVSRAESDSLPGGVPYLFVCHFSHAFGLRSRRVGLGMDI